MSYLHLKSLHIIFIVTWFAGLFYIVRLFIYFAEANNQASPQKQILQSQFLIMQKRLWYGITWPSAILAWIFGLSLWYQMPLFWSQNWFKVKLFMVFLLSLYHVSCQFIFNQQKKGIVKYSSQKLRVWNEVATIFLVSIVFLVELQHQTNWLNAIGVLFLLMISLTLAIRLYKKLRKN